MKNLWSDTSADEYADSPLQLRVYSSRLLGQQADLVLHGGGNTSVKITEKNIFGEDEETFEPEAVEEAVGTWALSKAKDLLR